MEKVRVFYALHGELNSSDSFAVTPMLQKSQKEKPATFTNSDENPGSFLFVLGATCQGLFSHVITPQNGLKWQKNRTQFIQISMQ